MIHKLINDIIETEMKGKSTSSINLLMKSKWWVEHWKQFLKITGKVKGEKKITSSILEFRFSENGKQHWNSDNVESLTKSVIFSHLTGLALFKEGNIALFKELTGKKDYMVKFGVRETKKSVCKKVMRDLQTTHV